MDTTKKHDALVEAITDTQQVKFVGVLYAEFGMRKTTTALRLSERRAVLLHADRGWQVINNHEEFRDRVIPIEYESPSQVVALVDEIVQGVEPFNDVDLIVLDTVSQMQENYIDFLLVNAQYSGNYREKAVARSGVRLDKDEASMEIPGMPDYHLARNKLRPVINKLVKAPINVMLLAHVREPSPIDRSNGKIERRPNVTEALWKVIGRDATFIGFINKIKGEYIVDFEPKNTQSAKSQIPELTDRKVSVNQLPEIIYKWSNNGLVR